MISPEFRTAVSERNLLRVKIMLKDSFVIDPTFTQLDEMLTYARTRLPCLFEPFDGGALENDDSKWNETVMNMELVQLINNFSEKRINHLKQVVAKVLKTKIIKIQRERNRQSQQKACTSQSFQGADSKSANGKRETTDLKQAARLEAWNEIRWEADSINRIMEKAKSRRSLGSKDVDKIESAAKKILKEVQNYRENR